MPKALDDVVERAMSKDPSRRFRSAGDLDPPRRRRRRRPCPARRAERGHRRRGSHRCRSAAASPLPGRRLLAGAGAGGVVARPSRSQRSPASSRRRGSAGQPGRPDRRSCRRSPTTCSPRGRRRVRVGARRSGQSARGVDIEPRRPRLPAAVDLGGSFRRRTRADAVLDRAYGRRCEASTMWIRDRRGSPARPVTVRHGPGGRRWGVWAVAPGNRAPGAS